VANKFMSFSFEINVNFNHEIGNILIG